MIIGVKMKIKQYIWDWVFKYDVDFVLSNINTDDELEEALSLVKETSIQLESIKNEVDETTKLILEKQKIIDELRLNLEILNKEDELETFWNDKRPKTKWLYPGRPDPVTGERMYVDPRIFYTYDETLPKFNNENNDNKASFCLDYVAKTVKYTPDEKEYWQLAYETYKRRKGDCEDGAILMANMMLMSGIPYWRIRLNAGNVKGGGHAWVTYLREKDNRWYVMDWCYWYSQSKGFKTVWDDAKNYFKIWCSWNKKYTYGDLPKETK